MLSITCTAEELARHARYPDYTGGTYAVYITPSAPGGMTLRPHDFVHSGRFAVGGAGLEGSRVFVRSNNDVGAITRAIVAMRAQSDLVGLWRDERGRLWVDAVSVYPSINVAMFIARERGELAIWDGIIGAEIKV